MQNKPKFFFLVSPVLQFENYIVVTTKNKANLPRTNFTLMDDNLICFQTNQACLPNYPKQTLCVKVRNTNFDKNQTNEENIEYIVQASQIIMALYIVLKSLFILNDANAELAALSAVWLDP